MYCNMCNFLFMDSFKHSMPFCKSRSNNQLNGLKCIEGDGIKQKAPKNKTLKPNSNLHKKPIRAIYKLKKPDAFD